MKKDKLKKVVKPSKIVKVTESDVKKMQKVQLKERRKVNDGDVNPKIEEFTFTKNHLVVLIILVLGIVMYYLMDNYHRIGLVLNREITNEDAVSIDTMYTDNIVLDYEDKILMFQKGTLTAYNSNGNEVWSKKLDEIYTPSINTSGRYIQVTNFDTGYIYVLDGQYEISRIKIEGEILSSKINSDGTTVVEYSTSGLKTALAVYNKKGNLLCSLRLTTNTLSDYALSENSKYLAYSYADISGISLVTKVDIVELEKIKNEGYNFETIIAKNNELINKMYWKGKNLNILLNDSIVQYNYSTKKVVDNSISTISVIDMDICDGALAYVAQDSASSTYLLNVTSYSLDLKSSTSLIEPPNYYMYSNGLIYVCYQKQMDIYTKHGTKVKSYTSDTVITKPVIYNGGKCVAMYISNKIITFKL